MIESPGPQQSRCVCQDGFDWRAADVFLFDIDGTLLNTHDAVHYRAFNRAFRDVWQIEETIDGVPWHGNTDIGIIRAVAARAGLSADQATSSLPFLLRAMESHLQSTRDRLKPETCAGIPDIVRALHAEGKILGVATGNIEGVGWAKLENAGLRQYFSFGAFSAPGCESREDVFRRAVELARVASNPHAVIHVVGDTPADIHAARAVGIPIIAVATGKYSFEELAALAPDLLLGCFNDTETLDSK
ncbi:MAG TPA: HAD family hydrolase [Terriglobales bacterium]